MSDTTGTLGTKTNLELTSQNSDEFTKTPTVAIYVFTYYKRSTHHPLNIWRGTWTPKL